MSEADGSFKNSLGMEMVKTSGGYYVSKYEIRQSEFEEVMGYNPSYFTGADHPVENITGKEAQEFCKKLTEKERAEGRLPVGYIYQLPSYAQWMEYVVDAGLHNSITPASGKQYESHQPVTEGEANKLRLVNLRGNVAEYSRNKYNTGSNMILGAWWNEHREDFLAVDNQAGFLTNMDKSAHVGFRCVLNPAKTSSD